MFIRSLNSIELYFVDREIKHYNYHYLLSKCAIMYIIYVEHKCANLLEKYRPKREYANAFETVRIC